MTRIREEEDYNLEGDEAVDGDELVLMLYADVAAKHEQRPRADKCHVAYVHTLCRHQLRRHTMDHISLFGLVLSLSGITNNRHRLQGVDIY